MTSYGHFQSFFIYFFSSPNPNSEKKIPVNQLIKKFWPKYINGPSKNIMVYPIIPEKVVGNLLTWDQMDTSKVWAKTECF